LCWNIFVFSVIFLDYKHSLEALKSKAPRPCSANLNSCNHLSWLPAIQAQSFERETSALYLLYLIYNSYCCSIIDNIYQGYILSMVQCSCAIHECYLLVCDESINTTYRAASVQGTLFIAYDKGWNLSEHFYPFTNALTFLVIMYSKCVWSMTGQIPKLARKCLVTDCYHKHCC